MQPPGPGEAVGAFPSQAPHGPHPLTSQEMVTGRPFSATRPKSPHPASVLSYADQGRRGGHDSGKSPASPALPLTIPQSLRVTGAQDGGRALLEETGASLGLGCPGRTT